MIWTYTIHSDKFTEDNKKTIRSEWQKSKNTLIKYDGAGKPDFETWVKAEYKPLFTNKDGFVSLEESKEEK